MKTIDVEEAIEGIDGTIVDETGSANLNSSICIRSTVDRQRALAEPNE